MVVNDAFVWLHFPKCAGVETEAALRLSPTHMEFDDLDGEPVIWHHTLQQREDYDPSFELGDRRVICNFRRLPNWIVSKSLFGYTQGALHTPREMLLQGHFCEPGGAAATADGYLSIYSSGVTHWIKTETLERDFHEVFGPLIEPLGPYAFQKRNSQEYSAPSFTQAELERLYDACPIWTQLERALYGNTLLDLAEQLRESA